VNVLVVLQAYLLRLINQVTVLEVTKALQRECKVTLLKRGFPYDYVLMALVVTYRQVVRADLAKQQARIEMEL